MVFVPRKNTYYLYNKEMCSVEVSPCSTFKIISTLIGLNNGIIESAQSKMEYNNTKYPVATWNADLSLKEAFQTSCVWYFRQIVDKAGAGTVLAELKKLDYGNCDISEWDGSHLNPTKDLNGFWLESSLKISPLEQIKILTNIFEGNTDYKRQDIEVLKSIMKIDTEGSMNLYGKTGTGIDGHAWFIGFIEKDMQRLYFAVYLNDNKVTNVSGDKAKEISINIMNDF